MLPISILVHEKYEEFEKKVWYPCSIRTREGQIVMSYCVEHEGGLILDRPILLVFSEERSSFKMTQYDPLSADEYFFIHSSDVRISSIISDRYLESYIDAANKCYGSLDTDDSEFDDVGELDESSRSLYDEAMNRVTSKKLH